MRASGSVVAKSKNRWFQHDADVQIKPGDTIVVRLDTKRMPLLPFWQAVTAILYNVALGGSGHQSVVTESERGRPAFDSLRSGAKLDVFSA